MKRAALLLSMFALVVAGFCEDSAEERELESLLKKLSNFSWGTNRFGEVFIFNLVHSTNAAGKPLSVQVPHPLVKDSIFEILARADSITNITINPPSGTNIFTKEAFRSLQRMPNLLELRLACFARVQENQVAEISRMEQLKALNLITVEPGLSHDNFRALADSKVERLTLRCEELCESNVEALSKMRNLKELRVHLFGEAGPGNELTNAFAKFPALETAEISRGAQKLKWKRGE